VTEHLVDPLTIDLLPSCEEHLEDVALRLLVSPNSLFVCASWPRFSVTRHNEKVGSSLSSQ
jgi:hypothetical protein